MNKIHVGNLILEVTRQCNMDCRHCLRGNCENLDMPDEVIEAAITRFDRIGSIAFTGGEPSLVPHKIKKALDVAKENKIEIGYFYIATNAKKVSDEFMRVLIELYLYCDDKDVCTVEISRDRFHERVDQESIDKLTAFRFTSERGELFSQNVIMQGRALENFDTDRFIKVYSIEVDDDGDWIDIDGEVYVNCKGNVLECCDLSYENQDREDLIVSSIWDEDLIEKMRERNYNHGLVVVSASR